MSYFVAVRLKMGYVRLKLLFVTLLIIAAASHCVEGSSHSGDGFSSVIEISPSLSATSLAPNVKYIVEGTENFGIYCFQTVPKSVFQIWRTVQLVLLDIPLKYEIFPGSNETEVYKNYQSQSLWHSSVIFSGTDAVIDFPAFSSYCVGISSKEKYSFYLKVRLINYWKVLQALLGILLYLTAPNLSRNAFFHYATGVSLGVLASFLILLYIISRFIPQRSASYAVLVFGYSFVLYILKLLWHHFHEIITQYSDIALGYCIIAAFLSFIFCYRIGPVKSERTFNIIQWFMQALSLLLIFFSSEYREVSTAMILLLLGVRMIPTRWIKGVQYFWYRCFPPKVKLLTELQFIEQGHIETKKALDNLRQYCNSPDCKVWKVVRKLKNPARFANFIETGSHYTDEELLDYNSEDYLDNNDADEDLEESTNC